MTVTKEVIAEALKTLDHKDDTLWTDDGAPLVGVVQKATNDTTVTRSMINDALPGFVRKLVDANETPAEPEPVKASAEPEDEEIEGFLTVEQERERIRAIAQKRVTDAELALQEAKAAVTAAHRAVGLAEQRHTRAIQQYSAKFPPMTAAANIKQHLASQQEALRERITGSKYETVALNPVDAKMMDRKRDNGRNGPVNAYLPRRSGAIS
jgi:hypothetical protein